MFAEKFLAVTQFLIRLLRRMEKPFEEAKRKLDRKAAYALAEEMHQRLQAKRLNPPRLTEVEEAARALWFKERTPREKCRHLKGAEASRWGVDKYGGPRYGMSRDYNVQEHTFIDGSTRIRCANGCGFESWYGDENWAEAKRMVDQSTNRPSSSERPATELKKKISRKG